MKKQSRRFNQENPIVIKRWRDLSEVPKHRCSQCGRLEVTGGCACREQFCADCIDDHLDVCPVMSWAPDRG